MPSYQAEVERVFRSAVIETPRVAVDSFIQQQGGNPTRQVRKLRKDVADVTQRVFDKSSADLERFRHRTFVQPVLKVVSILSIEDIAVMAETLVNLASFRQKISMSVETVGGPVDVAVISKGDGFVWIKRKRYFNLDQNPRIQAKFW